MEIFFLYLGGPGKTCSSAGSVILGEIPLDPVNKLHTKLVLNNALD